MRTTAIFVSVFCLCVFLSNVGHAVDDNNLVLYYSFDEGAGNAVEDVSDNGSFFI